MKRQVGPEHTGPVKICWNLWTYSKYGGQAWRFRKQGQVYERWKRKDADTGKDWRLEEKGTTDEVVGWHHWLNGHEFEQAPGDKRQGSLACCSPWGLKESDTTERLNWTYERWRRAGRVQRHYHLNLPSLTWEPEPSPPYPSIPVCGRNCLPRNQSLVPRRLGTTMLKHWDPTATPNAGIRHTFSNKPNSPLSMNPF